MCKPSVMPRRASVNGSVPVLALGANKATGRFVGQKEEDPPRAFSARETTDDMGPLTAKEANAVKSGLVSWSHIKRFRDRQAPLLESLANNSLWSRRKDSGLVVPKARDSYNQDGFSALLCDSFCHGVGDSVMEFLGGGLSVGALSLCSRGVNTLVMGSLEPLCDELRSRKVRRCASQLALARAATDTMAATVVSKVSELQKLAEKWSKPSSRRSSPNPSVTIQRGQRGRTPLRMDHRSLGAQPACCNAKLDMAAAMGHAVFRSSLKPVC